MSVSMPTIRAPVSRSARLIRLTPLIDVIFILLIFFMLASTLEDQGRVPLGVADGGAGSESASDQVHIELSPVGMRIDGEPLSSGDVGDAVRQRLRRTSSEVVAIRAHEGVTLERLLQMTADLRGAGIDDISLIPSEEP